MSSDPRRMRPSELCRILNSTPLGEVISERQLHRHRTRAGLRIGDARHIDLLRYVAWLIAIRHAPKPVSGSGGDPYDGLKDRARARNLAISLAGRDIGELPDVVNIANKTRWYCALKTGPPRVSEFYLIYAGFLGTAYPRSSTSFAAFRGLWLEEHCPTHRLGGHSRRRCSGANARGAESTTGMGNPVPSLHAAATSLRSVSGRPKLTSPSHPASFSSTRETANFRHSSR